MHFKIIRSKETIRLMFERCQKKVSAHLERKRFVKAKDITEISNPKF